MHEVVNRIGARRPVGARGRSRMAVVIALVAAVAIPTQVAASGSGWVLAVPPDPSSGTGSELIGVSCTSANACTGVGLAGNNPQTLVERWNGSSWSVQSTPSPGTASELVGVACVSSTSCVAVGDFSNGSGYGTLAESWNGTAWAVQTAPALYNGGSDGHLTGVSCTSSTSCSAVGWYSDSTAAVLPLAERWNGTAWVQQATPAQAGHAVFSAVSCVADTACTAVGWDNPTGAEFGEVALAEGWNGQRWTLWPTAEPAGVQESFLAGVSCSTPTDCMSVGSYDHGDSQKHGLAEHLDGTSAAVWADLSGGSYSRLFGVSCVAGTACTAVGTTDGASGSLTFATRFDGWGWTVQPTVDPTGGIGDGLSGIACTSFSTCMAVGSSAAVGHPAQPLAEGGASWSVAHVPLPSGASGGGLHGVACSSSTVCMAVGDDTAGSGPVLTLSAQWKGATWVAESTPSPNGAQGSQLNGVSCTSASQCTAVGTYVDSAGKILGLAERWNGKKWAIQATPNPTGGTRAILQGVSCASSNTCTAVGSYANSAGSMVPIAEAWNGSTWTLQAAPIPVGAQQGILLGVSCSAATTCMAVGDYTSSGGSLQTLAEAWNGTTWAIGTTPNPSGASAAILDGVSCTAATVCTAVGFSLSGASMTLAMRWDGASWAIQPTPNPAGASGDALDAVSCTSARSCTAVGGFSSGSQQTLAQTWNGSTWTTQATPNPAGAQQGTALLGVVCTSATRCTAVGDYVDSWGVGQPLAQT